jgi:uncharacterized membrane protein
MAIGVTLFIVAVLVVFIWIAVEIKRMKHKVFAIVLIALILLAYFSVAVVFKGQNVNLKTIPGIIDAVRVYFTYVGSLFANFVTITSHAIKMDWAGDAPVNQTVGK